MSQQPAFRGKQDLADLFGRAAEKVSQEGFSIHRTDNHHAHQEEYNNLIIYSGRDQKVYYDRCGRTVPSPHDINTQLPQGDLQRQRHEDQHLRDRLGNHKKLAHQSEGKLMDLDGADRFPRGPQSSSEDVVPQNRQIHPRKPQTVETGNELPQTLLLVENRQDNQGAARAA